MSLQTVKLNTYKCNLVALVIIIIIIIIIILDEGKIGMAVFSLDSMRNLVGRVMQIN